MKLFISILIVVVVAATKQQDDLVTTDSLKTLDINIAEAVYSGYLPVTDDGKA
jgi:hypothetical protein